MAPMIFLYFNAHITNSYYRLGRYLHLCIHSYMSLQWLIHSNLLLIWQQITIYSQYTCTVHVLIISYMLSSWKPYFCQNISMATPHEINLKKRWIYNTCSCTLYVLLFEFYVSLQNKILQCQRFIQWSNLSLNVNRSSIPKYSTSHRNI
jgi:hypothetical protein